MEYHIHLILLSIFVVGILIALYFITDGINLINQEDIKQDNINKQCAFILHPESNLTQYNIYQHCKLYPETYGART